MKNESLLSRSLTHFKKIFNPGFKKLSSDFDDFNCSVPSQKQAESKMRPSYRLKQKTSPTLQLH